ncbi:MAG: LysM peptidoglycan-binding domain-containing protein [Deltaproteobacteria bacterium]|nr:LysM peptidoglycan-binding domain-containing protein [Deltaproteobacteria bacterium]
MTDVQQQKSRGASASAIPAAGLDNASSPKHRADALDTLREEGQGNHVKPERSYTVQAGDTLYSIAKRANLALEAILESNPHLSIETPLKIGRNITLPGEAKLYHRIEQGETLYGIAQKYEVSLALLQQANRSLDPAMLKIGDQVLIPLPAGAAPPVNAPSHAPSQLRHTVSPGDTFYAISRQYGLKVEQLINANPEIDPEKLAVGATLSIPPGGKPAARESAPAVNKDCNDSRREERERPRTSQADSKLTPQELRDIEKLRSFIGEPYGVQMDCMSMVMRFARENYGVKLPGYRSDFWVPHLDAVTTITKDSKDLSSVRPGDIVSIGHPYRGSISVFHNVVVTEPIYDHSGKIIDFKAVDPHGNYRNGDRSKPWGKVREVPSLLEYLKQYENSERKSHGFVMRIPRRDGTTG